MSNETRVQEKNIHVNGITGGAYSRGIFSFTYEGNQIEFALRPNNENYNYNHHLEMSDILELNEKFPAYIPLFNKKEYRTWTNWGHKVEKGLYKLIAEGKFYLEVKDRRGEAVRGWLKWKGSAWRKA